MRLSPRRAVLAMFVFCAMPLLVACPKKDPPPPDAAPPPPPDPDTGATVLVPLEEDAGADADADAKKVFTGKPVNTNVARLKQCCNALSAEAKRLGASPEAGMFTNAAAQCTVIANGVGPNGNAPELGTIKTLLAGRTIPAVCAGF
jgi:hypothetical protein